MKNRLCGTRLDYASLHKVRGFLRWRVGYPLQRDIGYHLDTFLTKGHLQRTTDIRIHMGQERGLPLQNGHFGPNSSEKLSKFYGDRSAAQHEERDRRPTKVKYRVAGLIAGLIQPRDTDLMGRRAGGNHERLPVNPHISCENVMGRDKFGVRFIQRKPWIAQGGYAIVRKLLHQSILAIHDSR